MKIVRIAVPAFLSLAFFACGSEAEVTPAEKQTLPEDFMETVTESKYTEPLDTVFTVVEDTSGYFEIDIPANMKERSDLNPQASISYAYAAEIDLEVKELYVIVLMETYKDLESYDLDVEYDALSYSDVAVQSLTGELETYEVLSGKPKVQKINKMDAVITEMEGSYGEVSVFYKLGVYEGEKAFYQVLTWTIKDQKDDFILPMDKIIRSFREKK